MDNFTKGFLLGSMMNNNNDSDESTGLIGIIFWFLVGVIFLAFLNKIGISPLEVGAFFKVITFPMFWDLYLGIDDSAFMKLLYMICSLIACIVSATIFNNFGDWIRTKFNKSSFILFNWLGNLIFAISMLYTYIMVGWVIVLVVRSFWYAIISFLHWVLS
jgi:hypothetical protein